MSRKWTFEFLAGPFSLTEGPVWDGSGLLFSDIHTHRILRFDPDRSEVRTVRERTNGANGLVLDSAGRLLACEGGSDGQGGPFGRRVVRYELDGSVTIIAEAFEGRRLNSPNDLAIDGGGRVWFTDPRYGESRADMELEHESVYRATPMNGGGWSLERVVFDTVRPNGILLSEDQSTLYIAESGHSPEEKRQLRAYDVSPDGAVGGGRVLYDFGDSRGIDGMCFDDAGNILACCGWELSGQGPRIAVFTPDGVLTEQHEIPAPVRRPTNCTFGGPELATLYVTDIDGRLLRANTDRSGRRSVVGDGGSAAGSEDLANRLSGSVGRP